MFKNKTKKKKTLYPAIRWRGPGQSQALDNSFTLFVT